MKKIKITIEVSARHIHLSKNDFFKLFKKTEPTFLKKLSQSTDFAAKETIALKGKKSLVKNIRVIGPCREKTQAEISLTDAYNLGIEPMLRLSGNVLGSGSAFLIGPTGKIILKEGIIIAKRHIHCDLKTAQKIGLKNNQKVSVKVDGPRSLIFNNIAVRIHEGYAFRLHIDTDEANAAGIKHGARGELIL